MIEPPARQLGNPARSGISPKVLGIFALAVVTAVVAFAALGGAKTTKTAATTSTSLASVDATTSAAPPTTAAGLPPLPASPKPLPDGGLYNGRPPMFVVVSFDGAADQSLLTHWEEVTKKAPAHMSLFLSGVYLLGSENKDVYHGPRHEAGESGINFAPVPPGKTTEAFLAETVNGLKAAQLDGHELGTHYGGHWCGPSGVDSWNRADWAAELNQFDNLMNNLDANNKLEKPLGSPFVRPSVGSRTPCLEGNLESLYPVIKARGYRYDASGRRTLTEWPKDVNGLWQYGFPTVTIEGVSRPMLTVDFSLRENMDPKKDADDAKAKDISRRVYEGYRKGFDELYYGNRAPFEMSNHFVHFTKEAYNLAVEKLLTEVCPMPEVQCVNYRELTDWMDAHKDAINGFEKGSFPKYTKPAAQP
jgi:hypothetical protein